MSWKYCIDYLHQEGNLHCYAVKYSEPTRRRPVPRATASLYFYLLIQNKVWSLATTARVCMCVRVCQ